MTEQAVNSSLAATMLERFQTTRRETVRICAPLEIEDHCIQSMPDVSPPKWHLAHTTWFFENFLLKPLLPGYREWNERFSFLFNSYYEAVGVRVERASRGLLSRPTVEEVLRYREAIDGRVLEFLSSALGRSESVSRLVELGIQHEQQHQELLYTDIKHIFFTNPLRPVYRAERGRAEPRVSAIGRERAAASEPLSFEGGLKEIGHPAGAGGFHFDNESPRHRVFLEPFQLESALVTNGEYLEFIEDARGYENAAHWLSDGWAAVRRHGWSAPLYWEKIGHEWWQMTLSGMRRVRPDEPVSHVSLYEANAFANWKKKRLPTEAEWEVATDNVSIHGSNFADEGILHPVALSPRLAGREGLHQAFGDLWEWTSSPYQPYPGYRAPDGALGEYNGKFMCNQIVLKGGSCATQRDHIRGTYRNFFGPETRWQFSGIRLAALHRS